ncbi:hypothetical protein, partial [Streptantibioticus ferralitis]
PSLPLKQPTHDGSSVQQAINPDDRDIPSRQLVYVCSTACSLSAHYACRKCHPRSSGACSVLRQDEHSCCFASPRSASKWLHRL